MTYQSWHKAIYLESSSREQISSTQRIKFILSPQKNWKAVTHAGKWLKHLYYRTWIAAYHTVITAVKYQAADYTQFLHFSWK